MGMESPSNIEILAVMLAGQPGDFGRLGKNHPDAMPLQQIPLRVFDGGGFQSDRLSADTRIVFTGKPAEPVGQIRELHCFCRNRWRKKAHAPVPLSSNCSKKRLFEHGNARHAYEHVQPPPEIFRHILHTGEFPFAVRGRVHFQIQSANHSVRGLRLQGPEQKTADVAFAAQHQGMAVHDGILPKP